MSDQVELTNPVELSVGGMSGHILRRGIHLAMSFLPLLYFEFGQDVADAVSLSLAQVVSSIIMIAVFGEALRLRMGWTVVGQRSYEAKQVSALAWGALGVGMVFLLAPEAAYAYPLILSLSLGRSSAWGITPKRRFNADRYLGRNAWNRHHLGCMRVFG